MTQPSDLATLMAGVQPEYPYNFQRSFASLAVGGGGIMLNSSWYSSSKLGPSTAPTIGLNGEAVVNSLGTQIQGKYPRNDNPSGVNAYITEIRTRSGLVSDQFRITGGIFIIDRLWHNSGIDVTSTSVQTLSSPAAHAARDRNGAANGADVWVGIQASTAWVGAASPTISISYTNQDGTSGRTASCVPHSSLAAGDIALFYLQSGDTGVRSIQSVQFSAAKTSGAASLVLFRMIAAYPIPMVGYVSREDYLTLAGPDITDAVLEICMMQNYNSSPSSSGVIITESYV